MSLTLIAVLGIISIVAVTAFSTRLGIAAPLSLVVVGVVLSFIPSAPDIAVEPHIILGGVLPPLLYSAALNMPAQDFRRNIKAITGLAVVLVALTTVVSGALLHWVMPEIDWPMAFAIGAVISPTDAVAATSIGKRLGLPPRIVTMLEGEGLVNDASALVLLRSAIAAVAVSVSILDVVWDFVLAVLIAAVIGFAVAFVGIKVRALLPDPVLSTAISFVVPFVAFLPTESLDASGVLAVVVAGVVTGSVGPAFLGARVRWAETINWRTVAFLLESSIFLLMGLTIAPLLDEVSDEHLSAGRAVWIGLLLAVLVIALRLAFVVPLMGLLRRETRRAAETKPQVQDWREHPRFKAGQDNLSPRKQTFIEVRFRRLNADLDFFLSQAVGWRGGLVLGWAGMRGAITVAAAQTLPEGTAYRPQLILIAYVVAITTLLVQGLTIPAVIRVADIPADDPARHRADLGRLTTGLTEAGLAALEDSAAPDDVAQRSLEQARSAIARRGDQTAMEDPDAQQERELYAAYLREALDAQREWLNRAMAGSTYDASVITDGRRYLDLLEMRLQDAPQT
ncbi:cation:proton antiporter [Luteipulveratus mongoliensis]|uniref:Cation/H+ exchanger transmembrane domain-containing protein n=1 Tax=Luteipulveratus mongoliensis TaxID=571913 RepID=A0A0K1JEE7_9MICO|nr:sodium:proton antiporter [Luteipulveratus mongoliensis]AKU14968.1 hypothetical protein VV02_02280 [Luteipulveratus mongoliensis]